MDKTVDKILRLKSETEQLQSDRDKAKGALERMLSQIKEQFGCSTIEAAEKSLQRMLRKNKRMIVKRDRAIEEHIQEMESHDED